MVLILYIASLATLVAVARSLRVRSTPANIWRTAGLLFLALAAFGVGTCSALVGMPGNELFGSKHWPACLVLATMAVLTFFAGMGRPGKPAQREVVSYALVLLAIAMVVVAMMLNETRY